MDTINDYNIKKQFAMRYEEYKRKKLNSRIAEKDHLCLRSEKNTEKSIPYKVTSSYFMTYLNISKKPLAYLNIIIITIICTLISFFMFPYFRESNLILVYFLGITIIALTGQIGASILASMLSIIVYDFFFVPPFYSFSVSDIQSFFTFIVMLSIAQIITHLTIRVKHNIEATKNAEKETEKERFRNILLTSVSHDLRTPLTAIMGSASSLLQSGKKLSEEMHRELAKNIYDESERLNHLVNNILKIIRLEAGTIQLSKQAHALEEIIGTALNKLESQLTNKSVTVKIPKLAPLIPLDHLLIGQVFINLIENAIKFSPSGSPIDISVEFKVQKAIIKIADRGSGIDPKNIDKIFSKFYRGHQTETNGIGLGLAICKGIVIAHKGKIWAESRYDGGTIFCFTLPITG